MDSLKYEFKKITMAKRNKYTPYSYCVDDVGI